MRQRRVWRVQFCKTAGFSSALVIFCWLGLQKTWHLIQKPETKVAKMIENAKNESIMSKITVDMMV